MDAVTETAEKRKRDTRMTRMTRMTREEREKAIDALKVSIPIISVTPEEFKDYYQTLHNIMDLLEQQPNLNDILDKIRAEIVGISPKTYPFADHMDDYIKTNDVLRIIDKYKVETE